MDDLLWNGLGAAAGWLLADRLVRSAAPRAVVMPLISVPLIGLFYLVECRMPCDLV